MTAADSIPFQVMDTLETPNPLAYKYLLNQEVIDQGTQSFDSQEKAESFPFAKAVFALGSVQNVFLKENFVSVTFLPSNEFELLVEAVPQVVEDELTYYVNESVDDGEKNPILKNLKDIVFSTLSDLEKAEVVDAILDDSVRPALARDGGGLNVLEVEGNVVRIQYQGACGGCPSSQSGTLRAIQNILQGTLKEELVVVTS